MSELPNLLRFSSFGQGEAATRKKRVWLLVSRYCRRGYLYVLATPYGRPASEAVNRKRLSRERKQKIPKNWREIVTSSSKVKTLFRAQTRSFWIFFVAFVASHAARHLVAT